MNTAANATPPSATAAPQPIQNDLFQFDPLQATDSQKDEMLQGYLDGIRGGPPPRVTSMAYDWGRRNAANDRAGIVDPEQADVARRLVGRR